MEHFIIVAAGSGSRFGADVPKQFCLLDGRPVLMHTIERVRRAMPDARLVLVLSADMTDYWLELCRTHGNFQSPPIVHGGATRYHSVANALAAIAENTGAKGAATTGSAANPAATAATDNHATTATAGQTACGSLVVDDIVYIHDGARPLLDAAVIERLRAALASDTAAIPVLPVSDSLRRCTPDGASHIVDRSAYMAVQTPQAFRAAPLLQAYAAGYDPRFTDDASVVETVLGHRIALVPGCHDTIKITNPRDLSIVKALL